MKFILLSLVLCVTLLSCNPNNPTPNPNPPTANSVQTSWTMTIDNKTYSWSDTYQEVNGLWIAPNIQTNPGSCVWEDWGHNGEINSTIKLMTTNLPGFTEDDVNVEFSFYPMNVGSWTITENSWQATSFPSSILIYVSDYPLQGNIYTSNILGYPVNITLNITEFSTASGGYVKGNFNGTFTDSNNQAHTISGNFSAIRG
jgi:hypothetical protein